VLALKMNIIFTEIMAVFMFFNLEAIVKSTYTFKMLHVVAVHVDGVRLCLLTAATYGPIVHPPGDI
jgi:hypothetical protein